MLFQDFTWQIVLSQVTTRRDPLGVSGLLVKRVVQFAVGSGARFQVPGVREEHPLLDPFANLIPRHAQDMGDSRRALDGTAVRVADDQVGSRNAGDIRAPMGL